ncbi:MAG: sodium:calcium antiporter [Deltaproteobacteria bacterium]|nr:sodium:calcium antiporter [Deltaproteobacteria bacterium]
MLLETVAAGAAIFGSAFLLSWAAEAAQVDIPRALAMAFLALIAVLPEYAVDMYFAWQAPHREGYTAFATANMTGGNRLLIGLGWATVVGTAWLRTRARTFALDRSQSVEVFFLVVATLYSFVIPWKQTISLWDSAVLVSLFVAYMILAARAEHEEPELGGPAEWIAALPVARRRAVVVFLFAYSATAILAAAEPFAEGLVANGRRFGIEEFLLVQWLAPLASESPEFIICILFAWQGKSSAGISALVSSAVNQWTLLIGMLPMVYSLSAGAPLAMPLDERQIEEMLLTTAQSAFAVTVIADLRFSVREAAVLLVLFACQLVFTDAAVRYALSGLYLSMTVWILVTGGADKRRALRALPEFVLGRGG